MGAIIRSPKNFWMSMIYLGVGALGLIVGREYSFGSAGRMGPAYFPSVISGLLLLFGLITLVRSFVVSGQPISGFAVGSMLLVTGGLVAFAALVNAAGLLAAMLVMVLMSAAASRKFRFDWAAAAGLLGLLVFCALVFVKGLGIPTPLVGSWLQPVLPAVLGGSAR
jgi:hypothetical protein